MDTCRRGIENKIKIDYGIKDYHLYYKRKYKTAYKKYNLSSSLYSKIIDDFNLELFELIVTKGIDFEMPHRLGLFGIRKYKPKVKLNHNGTLINNLPVNPIETRKLWDTDQEAKDKKVFVRYMNKHSEGYLFNLHYFKLKAKYKNKKAYKIKPHRKLKRTLAYNIKNQIVDAFKFQSC